MPRRSILSILVAAAGGALSMYYFDPGQGARRRALLRDGLYSRLGRLDDAVRVAALDLRNRFVGTFGDLRQHVRHERVPDDVLAERVRARLGRVLSHPGSVAVDAHGGEVTVSGPILVREKRPVLRVVRSTAGVQRVVDHLEAHAQAGNVSALQGGVPREQRIAVAQRYWSPATRVLVGLSGAALAARGATRRSLASPMLLLAGVALLARASTNLDMQRLVGLDGRRGVDFVETLRVDAPVGA